MRQTSMFLKVKNISLLLVLLLVLCMGAEAVTCHAEELPSEKVTLSTMVSGGDYGYFSKSKYYIKNIDGLTDVSKVTITTDNPDVAGLYFNKIEFTKQGVYDKSESAQNKYLYFANEITNIDGKNFKINPYDKKNNRKEYNKYTNNIPKGTWYTDLGIEAKCAGTANITVSVDNNGAITSKKYEVTVNGINYNNKIKKKTKGKAFRTVDAVEFYLNKIAKYAKVTISCNKKVKLKEEIRKNNKTYMKYTEIDGKKQFSGKDIGNDIFIIPQEKGKLKFTIKVEQDGIVYPAKTFKLDITKYENPFSDIKIGNKNMTKYYKKQAIAGELLNSGLYKPLPKALCRYINGGDMYLSNLTKQNAKKINIKMNSGYTLVSIRITAWQGQSGWTTIKNGSPLFFDNGEEGNTGWFNEVYITYKDKNGRKWKNIIWL